MPPSRDPQRTPLKLSDRDLDAMTDPAFLASPEVTAETRAWWQWHAKPEDRNLLDPEPAPDGDDAPA